MVKNSSKLNYDHFSDKEISAFNDWATEHGNTILAPEKYYKSQKRHIIQLVEKQFLKNNQLSPREIVLSILAKLPNFLPANNIKVINNLIIDEWTRLKNA